MGIFIAGQFLEIKRCIHLVSINFIEALRKFLSEENFNFRKELYDCIKEHQKKFEDNNFEIEKSLEVIK